MASRRARCSGVTSNQMDAVDAVRAWLTAPPVPAATTRTDPGGWVATTYAGGSGHQAQSNSIRVLREKVEGGRALLAVEYLDTEGRFHSGVYGAVQTEAGTWAFSGGAGGAGEGEPARSQPWANLGGWGNRKFLCAGGRVHGDGVSRVRLVNPEGLSIEDQVEHGIALLIGDMAFSDAYRVELLDASDRLLASHPWGGVPAA